MSNEIERVANPLAPNQANNFVMATENNTMGAVASAGEMARVQAQLIYASSRPRNEMQAVNKMLNAFQRPSLARVGLYQYARGGSAIVGLSIRSAEAMAMAWGNIDFGVRELEQKQGESTMEAYAWDLETNVRRSMVFRVQHVIDTKMGRKKLEGARDIYEMTANQGSRRVRACILAILPKDIQDTVEQQIQKTLQATFQITPQMLKEWLDAFAQFGVTKQMIEKRIQRSYESVTPAQMMNLSSIFNSLKDGIGIVADFFEVEVPAVEKAKTLAGKAQASKAKAETEPAEQAEPVQDTLV